MPFIPPPSHPLRLISSHLALARPLTQAHTAGITVKMITGDSPDTARAIALALDIVTRKDAEAISGPQVSVEGFGEFEGGRVCV